MFDLHSTVIFVTNQKNLISMSVYARTAPNEKKPLEYNER